MHLYGRSSSHFTRIPRIFAAELEVDVEFHLIRDLLSNDADDYGGNPALNLSTEVGLLMGKASGVTVVVHETCASGCRYSG